MATDCEMTDGDASLDVETAKAFFKSKFIPGDNSPRDVACENALIMREKASLLIFASTSGGKFAPFMKSGAQVEDGIWQFSVNPPFSCGIEHCGDKYVESQGGNEVRQGK